MPRMLVPLILVGVFNACGLLVVNVLRDMVSTDIMDGTVTYATVVRNTQLKCRLCWKN
jgi:hypothetical protein